MKLAQAIIKHLLPAAHDGFLNGILKHKLDVSILSCKIRYMTVCRDGTINKNAI